jgi:hypothetical protein
MSLLTLRVFQPRERRELPFRTSARSDACALQEHLWADNEGNVPQSIPSELLRFGCQPTTLVSGILGFYLTVLENLDILVKYSMTRR